MKELTKEYGLAAPKIEEKNDFFDVEIMRPRPITTDNDQLADEKPAENRQKKRSMRTITDDYERLEEPEKQILLYLLDNNAITRQTAIELLNLQKTKVHEIFAGLVVKSYIIMKGKGRSTFYTLAEKVRDDE